MTRKARLFFPPLVLALSLACGALACGARPAPPPAPAPLPAPPPAAAPAPQGPDTPAEEESPIPISKDNPSWGSRDAFVTIVQFSDFECPFCARVVPTLEKVREEYGRTDLRIVYKHMPLSNHPHARPAAEAAQAAFAVGGSEAFWRFYTKAYGTSELPESFEGWASAIGVDSASYRAALASHGGAKVVDGDVALAEKLHVEGTPQFFVNGMRVDGAQPLAKFNQVIDDAMVQAKAAVERGVPREYIYLVASAFNVKNPPGEKDEPEAPAPADQTVWKMPVGKSPVRGPATAAVTIVEFSDFQCPFCGRVEATLRDLRSSYGDRIRLVWKNEPLAFHARAEPAAELAYEALAQKGNAGFWDAHDRLFADQDHLEDADLLAHARALHLDATKVDHAIHTHAHKAAFEADADLADELDASGTPYFFVNGRRLVGAQPIEKFRALIDEEEAKAKALVSKGTAPAAVYDELQKQAQGAPPPERKSVTLDPHAPSRGPAGAKVVIQEFADFQCPFCGRVEATLKEIEKAYPGRVRVVWRNLPLPFHKDAEPAAEAAMEAYAQGGQAAFWGMHDKLFANQSKPDALKRDALEQYARELGLDATKLGKAVETSSHSAAITADSKAASDAQISGTPAFVINGYFLSGAQPYPRFRRLVERALAEGKAAPALK
jgi:protein-disulfide isomerase